MVSKENLKKDKMFYEAGDRLKLMKAAECDSRAFLFINYYISRIFAFLQ